MNCYHVLNKKDYQAKSLTFKPVFQTLITGSNMATYAGRKVQKFNNDRSANVCVNILFESSHSCQVNFKNVSIGNDKYVILNPAVAALTSSDRVDVSPLMVLSLWCYENSL